MSRPGCLAATLLAVSLFGSCGNGGTAEGEPAVTSIPTPASTTGLALPLDPYRQSLEDYRRIQRASWLLTRDCVRRFGGEYTLSESAVVSNLPDFDSDIERRYGLFDAASAEARGYRVPNRQQEGDQDRRWNPSESELLLVRGGPGGVAVKDASGNPLPEGGCVGEATRDIERGAPAPPNERLGNELAIEAHSRAEADSRVRAAMTQWSDCMARAGYTYQSIWEPNDRAWPPDVGDAEIATAKADVRCKAETNLVGIWFAVESAYQERLLEENAQSLKVLKDFVEAQARNAARLVGG